MDFASTSADFAKLFQLYSEQVKSGAIPRGDSNNQHIERSAKALERLNQQYAGLSKSEEPLTVGIVGAFSSGKSSVINSLLGQHIIEDCVEPSTAVVTAFSYGDELSYHGYFSDGTDEAISKDEFEKGTAYHYDQWGNQSCDSNSQIDSFEVRYPLDWLRGIRLMDTPGFSSLSPRDDALTRKWINKFDVLVWVVDATKGSLDYEEVTLLEKISRSYGERLPIVALVNKMDNKPPTAREQILAHIHREYPWFVSVLGYSATHILKDRQAEEAVRASCDLTLERILRGDYQQFSISSDEQEGSVVASTSRSDDLVFQPSGFYPFFLALRGEIVGFKEKCQEHKEQSFDKQLELFLQWQAEILPTIKADINEWIKLRKDNALSELITDYQGAFRAYFAKYLRNQRADRLEEMDTRTRESLLVRQIRLGFVEYKRNYQQFLEENDLERFSKNDYEFGQRLLAHLHVAIDQIEQNPEVNGGDIQVTATREEDVGTATQTTQGVVLDFFCALLKLETRKLVKAWLEERQREKQNICHLVKQLDYAWQLTKQL